jgi:hypothetical protein
MARTSGWVRGLTVVVAVMLTAFSLGFTGAVVADYQARGTVPKGAVVDGIALGGMERASALEVIHRKVEAPLLAPLKLKAGVRSVTLDPATIVSVDVTGMVDAAFTPQEALPLTERVYRAVANKPLRIAVQRRMRVDTAALGAWVSSTAKRVRVDPRDATLELAGNSIRIGRSRAGQLLDVRSTTRVLSKALAGGASASALPVRAVRPKVTESAFARVIVVRLSACRLTLFTNGRKAKTYSVAVGQSAFPTPTGRFHVEGKEMWPTWINPGSGWASSMPRTIPPGPGNPLGSRAIAIDSPGIRIHGTSNDGSIGSAASHGCMRMHMWDVEDLYPRVQVGDRVIITH